MSITILNYHDQAFVDQINAEAAARAEAERAAAEAAKAQAASSDFSSVLTNATDAYSGSTTCSGDLSAIFDEAAMRRISRYIRRLRNSTSTKDVAHEDMIPYTMDELHE